eukprot:c14192_g1_i2 orf=215-424(+)
MNDRAQWLTFLPDLDSKQICRIFTCFEDLGEWERCLQSQSLTEIGSMSLQEEERGKKREMLNKACFYMR